MPDAPADCLLTHTSLLLEAKLFRDTFDKAAVGLAHVSTQWRLLRINTRLCEILGYTTDELRALTLQEITHPDDQGCDLDEFQHLLDGDIACYSVEKRFIHKQAHSVWTQVTASLIRTPAGEPDCLIAVVEDISGRKTREHRLHERELQNSIMAENMPGGLARLDAGLHFGFANHALEEAFNRPASDIIGRHASELYPPAALPALLQNAERALQGELVRYQTVYPCPGGEIQHIQVTLAPQRTADGGIDGLIMVVDDVSELVHTQNALHDSVAQLRHLAQHDTLTGLPNRALFQETLKNALAAARRNNLRLALVFMDLDEFKPVNDQLGHHSGDLVLQEAARRMRSAVRASDTVARIVGDEFVLLLPAIENAMDATAVALKVRELVAEPMQVQGRRVRISSSSGIAVFPDHADNVDELMSHADTAMYQAKRTGRNQVLVYDPAMAAPTDGADQSAQVMAPLADVASTTSPNTMR